MIGLFCKGARLKRLYSAKETYNFIDPTNRSHPICEGTTDCVVILEEVGGWGRDPKNCTGRDWGMGSSTI